MAARFKRGDRVRMLAPPNRTGTVVAVLGGGQTVWVNFPGWHIASFAAGALGSA